MVSSENVPEGGGGYVVKGSKGMLAYQASDRLGGLVQLSNNLVSTYYLCVQVDISEREKRERNVCQEEHFIGAAHCIRKLPLVPVLYKKLKFMCFLVGWRLLLLQHSVPSNLRDGILFILRLCGHA